MAQGPSARARARPHPNARPPLEGRSGPPSAVAVCVCDFPAPTAARAAAARSQGFVAKPQSLPDGTQDILNWDVVIPGKDGGLWEGARIPMTMVFTEDYPNKPPACKFKMVADTGKPLFHPNVYPSGKICLSLLDADKSWKPSLTIKHLLIGIQTLLDDPNNLDPAQEEPFRAYKYNKEEYNTKVKAQVQKLRT